MRIFLIIGMVFLFMIPGFAQYSMAESQLDYSLDVSLKSFTASVGRDHEIKLEWITESELDVVGYIIKRRNADSDIWFIVDSYLHNETLRTGGNSNREKIYTTVDRNPVQNSPVVYQLVAMNLNSTEEVLDTVEFDPANSPGNNSTIDFYPYPNPFNNTLRISITGPENEKVKILLYNQLGQLVYTLYKGSVSTTATTITFDAHKLTSGIYFITVTSKNYSSVKKIVLLR